MQNTYDTYLREMLVSPMDKEMRGRIRSYFQSKHPNLSVSAIGRSIMSVDIEAYRVGEGRKSIAVFASHHALESISSNVVYALIGMLLDRERLREPYGLDLSFILSRFSFWFVPCVNPDGVELRLNSARESVLYERQMKMSGGDFSTWQANARGVDLNHNYSFRFDEYKRIEKERGISAGRSLFSGEYPESEPETHSVCNFIRTLMPIAVISLHTQGEEIFVGANRADYFPLAHRLSGMIGYRVSCATDTACYGGLCDYTASIGIPSLTLELGRGVNPLSDSDSLKIAAGIYRGIFSLPKLV